jgi:hypothetical protein
VGSRIALEKPFGEDLESAAAPKAAELGPTRCGAHHPASGGLTYLLPANVEADMNLGANAFHVDGSAQVQPWAALALSRDLPLELTAMVDSLARCRTPREMPASSRKSWGG